jgi:hypothetical protein
MQKGTESYGGQKKYLRYALWVLIFIYLNRNICLPVMTLNALSNFDYIFILKINAKF